MERVWLVSYIAAWFLASIQLLSLAALLVGIGKIHLRQSTETHALITDEGPEIHSLMPEISGTDPRGGLVHIGAYRGREVVLLLVSPGCLPCDRILSDVRHLRQGGRHLPAMLVTIDGSADAAREYFDHERPGLTIIADGAGHIRRDLGVDRTPYAFLVDREGVVRMKGVINHAGQLDALIHRRGRHIGGMAWQEAPRE
jgi:methylamine dehydrogenase accessory protein MauD